MTRQPPAPPMTEHLLPASTRVLACALTALTLTMPAGAQESGDALGMGGRDAWTLIPEARLQLEYDSNALQLPGVRDDTLGKLVGGATFIYEFARGELGVGSATQLIGQYQGQLWRYAELPAFNVLLNILTVQLAERFDLVGVKIIDNISPFMGGQVVYKMPTGTGVSRLDFNVLAGLVATKAFGRDKALVTGYQFSSLLADVPQTAYSAHTLYVLYRMGLVPNLLNLSTSYQLQFRAPLDVGTAKQLRNTLGLSFQFTPVAGVMISVGGDYTNQYTAPLSGRIDYYSFNVSFGSDLLLASP